MELLKRIRKKVLLNGYINMVVKGSTLIETIFAMLVIMISFSICITIFSRLIANNVSSQELKANSIICSEVELMKRNKHFFSQYKLVENNWVLVAEVEPYENSSDHFILTVAIKDSVNRIIGKQKEIVYIED
jgi:hypothetical protein